jgi:putative DNA methylase
MVNDPGYQQGGGFKYGRNKKEAADERKRLFKIIEDLVLWENTTNEVVLERARTEIRRSWREVCELNKDHPQAVELFNPDKLPAFHDPFAGGGAIPLEAQRLGLESYATDLNPVAVLINKAMIEIPPKFAGRPPVSLGKKRKNVKGDFDLDQDWPGATGLAEDIRYYGEWMRAEAQKRIGDFYPTITVTAQMAVGRTDLKHLVGQKLIVTAWLWARTVKSPNPAFSHIDVPLAPTFVLSSKEGCEAYVQPVIEGVEYHFQVKLGEFHPAIKEGTKAPGRGANFRCILSDSPIGGSYIKAEAKAGRMGQRLLAVVAESPSGRIYLSPTDDMEVASRKAQPAWKPDIEFFQEALGFRIGNYGMTRWSDLFTSRQLVALTTFSDLVAEARQKAKADADISGSSDDGIGLDNGGTGITAYTQALSVYLSFAVSRASDYWGRGAIWESGGMFIAHVFSRNALPMTWDYPEANPFSSGSGSWSQTCVDWIVRYLRTAGCYSPGSSAQADAQTQKVSNGKVVSTDPPYYDNIGYADLSDYFYVWLRSSLRSIFPTLLTTITVPKAEELVATPERHGGRQKAGTFFLDGMTRAMGTLARDTHPNFPVTIYYAFKQAETETEQGTASTGWETFIGAVIAAGFCVVGTWPMRTERPGRMRDNASNALASSIIVVCRKRPEDAPTISRREFVRELNGVLPEALDEMTKGAGGEHSPVAPVDLSQAIIGPGMAVFSKYAAVLEADGSPMSVRTALQLINRFLAEDDFDADTQFCLHWFEQHGWNEGVFGTADTLARGKGTSVDGIKEAGVIQSGGGKVRLLKWAEYPTDWDPRADTRMPIWEALHQIIRALKQGGESGSGALLAGLGGKAEAVRQLAYRLYTLCERLGKAEDARAYNELITSWTGIESAAASAPRPSDGQLPGFEN